MKNPVFVAIVNFLLPGLGYLIIGKRVVFGRILFVGAIFGLFYVFLSPSPEWTNMTWIGFAGGLITMSAFAYDAYTLAKGK